MKVRYIRWLGWEILGGYIILVSAGIAIELSSGVTWFGYPIWRQLITYTLNALWIALGALMIMHQPRNAVGWLFCAGSAFLALDPFAFGYAAYSLNASQSPLPGTGLALLWLNWTGLAVGAFTLPFTMLLFPTGRLLSSRWRIVPMITIGGLLVFLYAKALEPEIIPLQLENPFAANPVTWSLIEPLVWAGTAVMAISIVAAWWSLVIRLRDGSGEERQQVKWIIIPTAVTLMGGMIVIVGDLTSNKAIYQVGSALAFLGPPGTIIGASFAILKYRLYDIDIVIHRTLVYGALSGTLALVYFTLVTLLQNLLSTVSGQQSAAAIVISTLVIAALFTPLRRRIQKIIDLRFYRRKYNAARTLAAFSATVRDKVDPADLSGALLRAVDETLQPASASLWLRESTTVPGHDE